MRFFPTCLWASLCLVAGSAQAQTLTDVKVGERVRVTAQGLRARESVLDGFSGDTITFRDAGSARAKWTVQYGEVERFEVRQPSAGSQTARGALIGLASGTAAAFGILRFVVSSCSADCSEDTFFAGLLSIPVGIVGGIIGGLMGHSHKTEGWQRLSLPLRITP